MLRPGPGPGPGPRLAAAGLIASAALLGLPAAEAALAQLAKAGGDIAGRTPG